MKIQHTNSESHQGALSRRNFIGGAAAAALTVSAITSSAQAAGTDKRFKLKYAPGPGMFRKHAGNDYFDNIKFNQELDESMFTLRRLEKGL